MTSRTVPLFGLDGAESRIQISAEEDDDAF